MPYRSRKLSSPTVRPASELFPAFADKVHLKSGSGIEGQVQVDEAKGEVRVKRSGATLTFRMDEVKRIERDDAAPAPEQPKPDDEPAPGAKVGAVVIPLHGNIDTHRGMREFDEVLEKAVELQPKIIVFEISSGGGAIAVARHISKRIRSLVGMRTAAFVWGPAKGAFSAAAYVALSCDRIYMSPGQAIGAAVAWSASANPLPGQDQPAAQSPVVVDWTDIQSRTARISSLEPGVRKINDGCPVLATLLSPE